MKSAVLLLAASSCLWAQAPLRFEVASVKQRAPGSLISMVGGAPSGSALRLEAMSVADLVSWAYDVKQWQVAGGPKWAGADDENGRLSEGTRRFDITAKAEGDAPPKLPQFREMLQNLLAERFHLAIHRESRQTPVYALVPDKNGSKVKESAPGASGVLRFSGNKIIGKGATMTQLVSWLSKGNGVDRAVVDQTGLTGHYDFTLEFSNPLAPPSADSGAPSIFTATVEQLGLKLEPRRAPLEFLVIDRLEAPGEN